LHDEEKVKEKPESFSCIIFIHVFFFPSHQDWGHFQFSFCLGAFWFLFVKWHREFLLLVIHLYYICFDWMVWQLVGYRPTVLYKKFLLLWGWLCSRGLLDNLSLPLYI
jgi:hypothetical protein